MPWRWDATGVKLRKKVKTGATTRTTHYIDGFQYSEDKMDFFPTAEGYVNVTQGTLSPTYNYVYNYTDHLGNIRLRYTKNPGGSGLRILEEDHYYPFGLKHQGYNGEHEIFEFDENISTVVLNPVNPLTGDKYKYKFNGLEWQSELDLNYYDFGMRNYDPALGRWMNIDPLAEMMRRHSPYNYAFNNPVYFIDPDGMMSWGHYGSGNSGGGFTLTTLSTTGEVLDVQTVSSLEGTGLEVGWNEGADGRDLGGGSTPSPATQLGTPDSGGGGNTNGSLSPEQQLQPNPFTATVVIDKSVPKNMFEDIAVIREDDVKDKKRTFSPEGHGKINKVDGVFLKEQPEGKSWFKISNYSEATIYYNSTEGLYIKETTARLNPVRLSPSYYVDWVDEKEGPKPPAKNPYTDK